MAHYSALPRPYRHPATATVRSATLIVITVSAAVIVSVTIIITTRN